MLVLVSVGVLAGLARARFLKFAVAPAFKEIATARQFIFESLRDVVNSLEELAVGGRPGLVLELVDLATVGTDHVFKPELAALQCLLLPRGRWADRG